MCRPVTVTVVLRRRSISPLRSQSGPYHSYRVLIPAQGNEINPKHPFDHANTLTLMHFYGTPSFSFADSRIDYHALPSVWVSLSGSSMPCKNESRRKVLGVSRPKQRAMAQSQLLEWREMTALPARNCRDSVNAFQISSPSFPNPGY